MHKLETECHPQLSENVLKVLFKNKVISVVDFISEDIEKLSALTKLNIPMVLSIRTDLLSKYASPVTNAQTLLNTFERKSFLDTGITSLDELIGGGIRIGYITEICGLADSGKTQLCFQITINCIRKLKINVLYVDTKGDFSAMRIQKLLNDNGCSHEEMAWIMQKIKIVRIYNMEEIVELLYQIKNKVIVNENLQLIIIDSLPSLMFQHLGDQAKLGLTLLNNMVSTAKALCKQMNIAIICTNILTRWVHHDFSENDDQTDITTKEAFSKKEIIHRCLGQYWQHIPGLVLMLTKHHETISNEVNTCLIVTVVKYVEGKCNISCNLTLSQLGVF